MALIRSMTCWRCGLSITEIDGKQKCGKCEMVVRLRTTYGTGESSDRLIAQLEGPDAFASLCEHETLQAARLKNIAAAVDVKGVNRG